MSEGPGNSEEHERRRRVLVERIIGEVQKRRAEGNYRPRVPPANAHELPDDEFHGHVYVNFGWLACESCKVEPDLAWAWDGLAAGEEGAITFTVRAVKFLKDAGWRFSDCLLWCPDCAAKAVSENLGLD